MSSEEIAKSRAVISQLELEIARKLDGLLQGEHIGLFGGHGSELGETRSYQPGDDTRRIDWNVTARLREPHIRETIADRELTCWLIVDNSARSQFGTAAYGKNHLILAGAAAIGFLVSGNGNKLGAVVVSNTNQEIIPPRSSRKHVQHILSVVANTRSTEFAGTTSIDNALKKTAALSKGRSLIVLISDLIAPTDWFDTLNPIAKKHAVTVIQPIDPRDFELPNIGHVNMADPATGETFDVDTQSATIRSKFAQKAAERQSAIDDFLVASGANHFKLRTDSDPTTDIVSHLAKQKRLRSKSTRSVR